MKSVKRLDDYLSDKERISDEDLAAIEFEKSLILKLAQLRESNGMSQRALSIAIGVKQPAIARLESLRATPQLDTLLRLLVPLGYTIEIVPIQK